MQKKFLCPSENPTIFFYALDEYFMGMIVFNTISVEEFIYITFPCFVYSRLEIGNWQFVGWKRKLESVGLTVNLEEAVKELT